MQVTTIQPSVCDPGTRRVFRSRLHPLPTRRAEIQRPDGKIELKPLQDFIVTLNPRKWAAIPGHVLRLELRWSGDNGETWSNPDHCEIACVDGHWGLDRQGNPQKTILWAGTVMLMGDTVMSELTIIADQYIELGASQVEIG